MLSVYTFNAKLPLRRHPAQPLLCISTIATWELPALVSSVTKSLPLWTQLPSQVWLPRLVPHSWSLIPLKHRLCQPLGSSWTMSKATARGFVIQLLILRITSFQKQIGSVFWHCFLAQYFISQPFHIVWFILLGVFSQALFLDVFRQWKPSRLGKTLSFGGKSLSFLSNSLSFYLNSLSLFKRMEFFFPKFPEFSQF